MTTKSVTDKTSESTQEVESPMIGCEVETVPQYLDRVEAERKIEADKIAALYQKGMNVKAELASTITGKVDWFVFAHDTNRCNVVVSEPIANLKSNDARAINPLPSICKATVDILTSYKNQDTTLPVSAGNLSALADKGYYLVYASWYYGAIRWEFIPKSPMSIDALKAEILHNASVKSMFVQSGNVTRSKATKEAKVSEIEF